MATRTVFYSGEFLRSVSANDAAEQFNFNLGVVHKRRHTVRGRVGGWQRCIEFGVMSQTSFWRCVKDRDIILEGGIEGTNPLKGGNPF